MWYGTDKEEKGDGKMKVNNFGKKTQAEICELEKRWHLTLPEDYKAFLMETNGGVVKSEDEDSIHIEDVNDDIYLDTLFGIDTEAQEVDAVYWMETYKDEIFLNALLIGFDLMQGFIVLLCGGEDAGVYYWDDAYNFKGSDDENNVYFIADSFSELLKKGRYEGTEEPPAGK